ncbi:DUF7503 family protein [Haloarchaeobius sp. TZWWS8]|uniref:DUF7503 family protein n=1 Tax=Haloarchaeobius sp. TZWWS8 TaxID=3446121 RepID=UPI003EC0E04A
MVVPLIVAIVMQDNNTLKNYLADHPRMIGVLFMIGLLLMQASPVIAADGSAGP